VPGAVGSVAARSRGRPERLTRSQAIKAANACCVENSKAKDFQTRILGAIETLRESPDHLWPDTKSLS
jgi:hypothetical protein